MANITSAVEFVLKQEDSTLSGITTNTTGDNGGLTRYGVSAKFHPELVRQGFYICGKEEAFATAIDVYKREYADPMYLSLVDSQAIATAMLSFAILRGVGSTLLTLQAALNDLGERLVVDGSMGPKTLTAINRHEAHELMDVFVARTKAALTQITVKNPTQVKWLNGWMNRCNAVQRLAQGMRVA